MTSRCLATVCLACALGAVARADSPADETKKLGGIWVAESATSDGKAVEAFKGLEAVFAGDKLTTKGADGKEQKFACKIDPSQKPKSVDFTPENRDRPGPPSKAIYELEGDTLKLCLGAQDKRPTEFTDKGQILIALKRKK